MKGRTCPSQSVPVSRIDMFLLQSEAALLLNNNIGMTSNGNFMAIKPCNTVRWRENGGGRKHGKRAEQGKISEAYLVQ